MSLRFTSWYMFGCFGGMALAAAFASGQPVDMRFRTGGLLVADQTLDTIYRTRDLDGDGAAESAGEVGVFLDLANPFGASTSNVFCVFQSAGGWVYFSDGDADAVYRVRDSDGDGAPDEGGVWLSGDGNAAGFTLATPNGLWEPEPGVVFVLNAGTSSLPEDAVYRTEDLNGDGDAEDAGEATLWMDLYGMIDSSSAFEVGFIDGAAYFADLRGGDIDAIIRAEDTDGDGVIASDEWVEFLAAGNPWGVPVGFVTETDGVSLYVADSSAGNNQTVYRLTDWDGSGAIDDASEVELVWHEDFLPAGAELGSLFTIALGPGGSLAIGSSGSDAQDAVYLATDSDGDGVFLSAGETAVWRGNGGGDGELASRVRALEFALGEGCEADFNGDGKLDALDFLAYLNAWSSGDPRADWNDDQTINALDFLAYLNDWGAGC